MLLDGELQKRMLLYGHYMEHQHTELTKLPGFAELPLPRGLSRQLSTRQVEAPKPTWRISPDANGVGGEASQVEGPRGNHLAECTCDEPASLEEPHSGVPSSHRNDSSPEWGNGRRERAAAAAEAVVYENHEEAEGRIRNSDDSTEGILRMANERSESVTPLVRSWLFKTSRLRRVRFTYFDGGTAVQAFNSLCYPHPWLDVPLLGVDLLSFGRNKLLCVVDFQPVTNTHCYPAHVEEALVHLRQTHSHKEDLFGPMSSRFFDNERFFSPHLLLLRSSKGWQEPMAQVPRGALFSVLSQYLTMYHSLIASAPVIRDKAHIEAVRTGQKDYDCYFATTDPAIALFNTYFGEQWSQRYTNAFLFPQAHAFEPK